MTSHMRYVIHSVNIGLMFLMYVSSQINDQYWYCVLFPFSKNDLADDLVVEFTQRYCAPLKLTVRPVIVRFEVIFFIKVVMYLLR